MFYSSNKEITLDEVIFSSYIWKIESQLFWSGSSLGHKQRRGLRHLYCTSKRRFKGAVLTLSTWTLSVGTTSEVTDHILGAGKYCFGLFCDAPWPLGLLLSRESRLCGFCHLWQWIFGRENDAQAPVCISAFEFLLCCKTYSVWFQKAFQCCSLQTLPALLHLYTSCVCIYICNFPTIRC